MSRLRSATVRSCAAIFVLAAACAQGSTSIGPLTLDIPEGWQVADREDNSLKLTDGTIGQETSTKPGTATAVFDIYTGSTQTLQEFRKILRQQRVSPKEERLRVDDYDAVLISYGPSDFGPRTDVVFVPEWRVQIVYRAAFPTQDAAFFKGRAAFREALRSISFEGRPPSGA